MLEVGRRERRWESRRDLIVRAAVEVVSEMGIDGATLDAVGERVGLSKASLYYYVKSKEELLGFVLAHVVADQEEAMGRLLHDGMSPEERLRAFCLGHLQSLFTGPMGATAARLALSGHKDAPIHSVFREYMARLEAILADGVAAGAFCPMDPSVVRNSILAALNAVPLWYSPEGSLSVEEVGGQICDLVISGLVRQAPPAAREQ